MTLANAADHREAQIAAKQRITLGRSARLIGPLLSNPRRAFKSASRRAGSRSDDLKQIWARAIALGSPEESEEYPTRREIGLMFKAMFQNELGVQDEDKWEPVKPLGNGSFGAAGLFRRIDDSGEADDYVVIKTVCAEQGDIFDADFRHISREAAIMMQLNEIDNPAILFLRNYKYFESTEQFVYFLEYCPSFSIEFLRLNYKAMKLFVPELFLWFMFLGFAKGLIAMEDGPFGDYLTPNDNTELYTKQRYVIHRDIKPDNLFLGYAPSETKPGISRAAGFMGHTLHYPHLKIADFGLSVITSLGDEMNRMKYHRRAGSQLWFPPEMLSHRNQSDDWNPFEVTLFNGEQEADSRQNHAYTMWANTFVAGFVMYQLATLDEPDCMAAYLRSIMRQEEAEPQKTVLNMNTTEELEDWLEEFDSGFRFIPPEKHELYDKRLNTYNMLMRWNIQKQRVPELASLIEQCMAFRPEDRIDCHELLRQIERIMSLKLSEMISSMSSAAFQDATRVFSKSADLGQMRRGNAAVEPADENFWLNLLSAYKWADPNCPIIQPDLTGLDENGPIFNYFSPGRTEARNRKATGFR